MQRLARYQAVAEQLIASGHAYRCWCTPEELDAMREAQRERGEKTRYDGRWRPTPGKVLPPVPEGVQPVIRFANPTSGNVRWDDLVKGPIVISNSEIDDLILVRPDGVPTYNFAVVVDDWDMRISHVFRGDEHINNTPWQINLFRALGLEPPLFGHHPIILGEDGLKLSKRRGAVSVTAYEEMGYLPEAMLNYLARLGWSHGDDELFTREQMVRWFDGSHLARSPAQWDPAKLAWVNAHYLKQADDARLAALAREQLARRGVQADDLDHLRRACALFKDRCTTTVELADWLQMYFTPVTPSEVDLAAHVGEAAKPAIRALREQLASLEWTAPAIAAAMKSVLAAHGLKMPQLAPALRVLVCGRAQTPSIDAVLALFSREHVLERLSSV
jgi:glutamyl-tRNA synthetase